MEGLGVRSSENFGESDELGKPVMDETASRAETSFTSIWARV
jgi:hypothetical protein